MLKGEGEWLLVPRYRCDICKRLHRVLPWFVVEYRLYSREVIRDSLSGVCQDGPCDMTVKRWSQEIQGL